MTEIRYVITDEEGIHARPAGNLVKFVKGLGCAAIITKGEKTTDLAKLMAVMSLGVKRVCKINCVKQHRLFDTPLFLYGKKYS
ncbi:MAG: HPr family phosphocarrier protein, partial [Eubacterium sp.]|nr:HPr family phosphocarrier protein [Eubacterium sp.]